MNFVVAQEINSHLNHGEKYSIDSIKIALEIGFDFIKANEMAKNDGKYDAQDILLFMPIVIKILSNLNAFKNLPNEAKDLSDEESRQIKMMFARGLDLKDDLLEKKIEAAFSLAIDAYKTVLLLVSKPEKSKYKVVKS